MYFGKCPVCGAELEAIWFEEEEEVYEPPIKYIRRTGRKRRNVNYLECPECWHKEAVDHDSYAEDWR